MMTDGKRSDALDHERTVGSRDEDGRVWMANNHVFIPSVVEGVDIFKLAPPGIDRGST